MSYYQDVETPSQEESVSGQSYKIYQSEHLISNHEPVDDTQDSTHLFYIKM